ncbi:ribosomal protein L11 methyltransferase [Desulfofarcimen acetoxidans DSM 771]|uniref:Ribosomal protein L11 methyltransferase n=2 Tax=Desulfofarcimen acetoxidans TaxID=58138 RepID=C8W4S3_DESAS|nr:ribosomal protein L11 methyltransferase [Desulfofarcimen acetoxidans DSM 771]
MEVAVRVLPEGVEPVGSIFDDLGTGGTVIEDPALSDSYRDAPADTQALDFSTEPQAWPQVKAYLPVDDRLEERLQRLRQALADLPLREKPELSTRELPETDWATAWQAYYKPVEVGRKLVVKPSWEDYQGSGERLIIELDPGMAFGSGTHATTVMCMELLEEYLRPGDRVIDVGTGSGILAVTAAKLGAGSVRAVDNDPVAVRVALENAELNGVTDKVEVLESDLLAMLAQGAAPADLLAANIIADVIIKLAADAARFLVPGGRFIASGIIKDRDKDVRTAINKAGFTVREIKRDGEWVAVLSVREA